MILHCSASVLHFCGPKLLSQLRLNFSSFVRDAPASSLSSSPVGFRLFWLNQPRLRHVRAFGTSSAASDASRSGNDTFFAEEGVTWTSIGVSDKVARALTDADIERPSLVQAACIPSILSGKDVVIAAETGSGKTYGYLAPLIDKLCRAHDDSVNAVPNEEVTPLRRIVLVLCPNIMLCEQVVRMAYSLRNDSGQPLLTVATCGGRQGWPVKEPDIIVSTPTALLNDIDTDKRRRLEFLRGVKYVVFDEADMLLCGSFENQVIRLIYLLRFDEKLLSRTKSSTPEKAMDLNDDPLLHIDSLDEEEMQTEIISEDEEDSEGDDVIDNLPEKIEAESFQRKDRKEWWRARKIYERSKQYVFVAATLPVNGKKTAGEVLKRMFPDANWVTGNYLHFHNPRMEQKWIEVSVDTQVDALIDAVHQGSGSEMLDNGADVSRTMVFANTVEAAEAVAKILSTAGIECYRYHKGRSFDEREKALVDFQEIGGILVCTDAAARGIDIPNVSHVIQADFATSAVDFLHRIGRTARAGKYGRVTSLYTESDRDLVSTVRRAGELGQPVETAFSRKRGFRNRLKKMRGLSKAGNASFVEEGAKA
uniref:RNA helicase n=1 Tax=Pelargonium transvaalense TaxID=158603 RepID=A0A0G2T596_9ROSI|nr:DEA(D/H)-box RNA helicase family protein [Pelargonium transvaalense]